MSEFTYGNIIRMIDKSKLQKHLPSGTPTLKLSEDWLAFFTPEDGEFTSSRQVEALSVHCPILYFTNLEDHGWGYKIIYKGSVISELTVLYDEFMDDEDQELLDEYGETIEHPLNNYNYQIPSADSFTLFSMKKEQIKSIEELLVGSVSSEEDELIAVESFKELLGIEEMSWIRYERTEGREGIEYI